MSYIPIFLLEMVWITLFLFSLGYQLLEFDYLRLIIIYLWGMKAINLLFHQCSFVLIRSKHQKDTVSITILRTLSLYCKHGLYHWCFSVVRIILLLQFLSFCNIAYHLSVYHSLSVLFEYQHLVHLFFSIPKYRLASILTKYLHR